MLLRTMTQQLNSFPLKDCFLFDSSDSYSILYWIIHYLKTFLNENTKHHIWLFTFSLHYMFPSLFSDKIVQHIITLLLSFLNNFENDDVVYPSEQHYYYKYLIFLVTHHGLDTTQKHTYLRLLNDLLVSRNNFFGNNSVQSSASLIMITIMLIILREPQLLPVYFRFHWFSTLCCPHFYTRHFLGLEKKQFMQLFFLFF